MQTGGLLPSAGEDEIYRELGLPFIPPEIRNGDDELAAARRGALPTLVSRQDVRGDLHLHSLWSDGRDSLEAMVEGCAALGYEYMAITDHSQSSAASRNLTIDGVKAQADEVAALRERHPSIQILHGCEVDILESGRLDFPDPVLERFDIVLASLHDRAGHSPDQLMKRYVAAMQHPLVTVITHPTNRMLAGLIRDEERNALDGVPGLSDIPLVGRLFAHNTKSTTQTDVILTLTPHIIRVLDLNEADLRPFRVGRDSLAPITDLPPLEPPRPAEPPKEEAVPPKKPGGR